MSFNARWAAAAAAAAIAAGGLLAACGGDDNPEPTALEITAKDAGKGATLDMPSDTGGGLTEVTLTNDSQTPQEAQLVQLDEGFTSDDVLKSVGGGPIPDWAHLQGGVGTIAPGESATATVNLPEGNYTLVSAPEGSKAPAVADLTVGSGEEGDLPSTDATVTAADEGDDEYKWEISGLTAGENTFTFNSEGDDAVHHLIMAPIVGDASIEDVKSELESNGPPKSIDVRGVVSTAVLDGDRSQVAQLNLEPGRYAAICFLSDRDSKKPHFEEGLLDEVDVK
jgi:uncharacterized cupredoxin-like copper-binding protein